MSGISVGCEIGERFDRGCVGKERIGIGRIGVKSEIMRWWGVW